VSSWLLPTTVVAGSFVSFPKCDKSFAKLPGHGREIRTYAAVVAATVVSATIFVLVLDVLFGRPGVSLFGS
jgi:hypothetical protein